MSLFIIDNLVIYFIYIDLEYDKNGLNVDVSLHIYTYYLFLKLFKMLPYSITSCPHPKLSILFILKHRKYR